MAKLTPLQQYAMAAAAGAVVCFCLVMAWQQMFTPVQPVIDSTEFIKERTQLENKAKAEAAARITLEVKVQALTDTINQLRKLPAQIHRENETTRAYNWNLSNDSASALLRARLATEDTHRLRYVYHTYTLPGKAN